MQVNAERKKPFQGSFYVRRNKANSKNDRPVLNNIIVFCFCADLSCVFPSHDLLQSASWSTATFTPIVVFKGWPEAQGRHEAAS